MSLSTRLRAAAPDINAGEQKQPHDVDEVPVPGREFKSEMLGRLELSCYGAEQADDQKDGADDYMGTVKPGRHEESGAIDVARIVEHRVLVFPRLHAGEAQPQGDGERQPPHQSLAIVFQERVVRPGYRRTRGEQNERVQEWEVPRIERVDALGRPDAAGKSDAGDVAEFIRKQRGVEIGPEPGDEEH